MDIIVQPQPFDAGELLNSFTARVQTSGAVVSFTGVVRDIEGGLSGMELEHYPGMTERALSSIRDQAMTRWPLEGAFILHRYGKLAPQEPIMMVMTASRHRAAAFEAAEFLMDYLKSRAPFWKKEWRLDGETQWVDARESDETALKRWQEAPATKRP